MPASRKHLANLKKLGDGVISVLAEWEDERYYKVEEVIELSASQCRCKFADDDTVAWMDFDKIHLQLDIDQLPDDVIICAICDGDKSKAPNEIILCDHCNQGYHLNCHQPRVLRAEANLDDDEATWCCSTCSSIIAKAEQERALARARTPSKPAPQIRRLTQGKSTPKVKIPSRARKTPKKTKKSDSEDDNDTNIDDEQTDTEIEVEVEVEVKKEKLERQAEESKQKQRDESRRLKKELKKQRKEAEKQKKEAEEQEQPEVKTEDVEIEVEIDENNKPPTSDEEEQEEKPIDELLEEPKSKQVKVKKEPTKRSAADPLIESPVKLAKISATGHKVKSAKAKIRKPDLVPAEVVKAALAIENVDTDGMDTEEFVNLLTPSPDMVGAK